MLNENHFLTSFKGRYSVANWQRMTIKHLSVDLVNDNLYSKFGKILCIHSQDMERKPNSDVNQGP